MPLQAADKGQGWIRADSTGCPFRGKLFGIDSMRSYCFSTLLMSSDDVRFLTAVAAILAGVSRTRRAALGPMKDLLQGITLGWRLASGIANKGMEGHSEVARRDLSSEYVCCRHPHHSSVSRTYGGGNLPWVGTYSDRGAGERCLVTAGQSSLTLHPGT